MAFLVGLVGAARGDGPADGDAMERGARARQAKRWTEAVSAYREALSAAPASAPALLGLGEALLGAGERGEGLECLRRLVERAEPRPEASGRGDEPVTRARKLLQQLDREGVALEKRIDAYVAACARWTKRWASTDPAAAAAAWADGAALRPEDPELGEWAWRLGLLPEGVALFDGATAQGWSWMEAPLWTIQDEMVLGRAADVYSICKSTIRLSGEYDLRSEVKVLEGGAAVFLLQGAWNSTNRNISLGMVGKHLLFVEGWRLPRNADAPRVTHLLRTKSRVDPSEWNLFELRFRRTEVSAWVNGERVGTIERDAAYTDGHVGLVTLAGTTAFRRVRVVQR